MRLEDIVKGGQYKNKNEAIREVIDIGDYPLYDSQTNRDCVLYRVIDKGRYGKTPAGEEKAMTRHAFANWAMRRVK